MAEADYPVVMAIVNQLTEEELDVAFESAGDQASSQRVELKLLVSTLCLHGCFLVGWLNLLIAQLLCQEEQPLSTPLVSLSG